MDLRDIVRAHPDIVVGHKSVEDPLNVRREVRRFSSDPLAGLINRVDDSDAEFFHGDVGRYVQAFSWYALSLKRTLIQGSLARRCDSQLRYHRVGNKYSARQKALADKRRDIAPFLELDYQNLIIHACILLDRVVTLSRRFLSGPGLPSFTSFSRHKEFLSRNPRALGPDHKQYVAQITATTEWSDIPLKVLRDKFLMHSAEKHMSLFGWDGLGQWDLGMVTIIAAAPHQEKLLEKTKVISFTPRRLARDMESLLSWFSQYGQTRVTVS